MEARLHSSTEASLKSLSNEDGDGNENGYGNENGDGNENGYGNENGKKSNGLGLAKQQLCTCTTLFVHFLAVTARLGRENV